MVRVDASSNPQINEIAEKIFNHLQNDEDVLVVGIPSITLATAYDFAVSTLAHKSKIRIKVTVVNPCSLRFWNES